MYIWLWVYVLLMCVHVFAIACVTTHFVNKLICVSLFSIDTCKKMLETSREKSGITIVLFKNSTLWPAVNRQPGYRRGTRRAV